MKLIKSDSPFLTKDQWRKVFTAMSIMTIALYIVAMVFSLCGSKYFILNYQNTQMDKIENFLHQYSLYPLIVNVFLTIEFTIILTFVLGKFPKFYYILIFYALPLLIHYLISPFPEIVHKIYPFAFYFVIPVIQQLIDNKHSEYNLKFSWKKYGFQMIRLAIAVTTTLLLQAMILIIKAGYFDGENHRLTLSGYFVYSMEYDIALLVILFTISLYINREKGDSKVWTTGQDHGGSSQTSKTKSQKSLMMKNLTKTQRNKLRRLYAKVYLIQLGTFLVVMILPFLTGKVFEFLMMYLAFCVVRYILGFSYSLHFKKESLCAFVGAIVFGILTLAVPFFYVDVIIALVMGIGLAILLHLSYKYKAFYLFNKIAKPDKFAVLYVYFDGDLDKRKVINKCKMKNLTNDQCNLIADFTQGEKISYLAWKYNYSQRMLIYKLDEAIDKLTA